MSYDREQQQFDLALIAKAEECLSARRVGEKLELLAPYTAEFARIASYHDGLRIRTVARMFWALATHPKINGMECREYTALLPEVRKLIKSKVKVFRRPKKTCLKPDVHIQRCFCAHLAVAKQRAKEEE